MLYELKIHNFAIIEDISLEFHSGMTVLTGETGAGKSIIIDAVSLLAGGRGSADYVRHGTKKCVLEGHFQMPKSKQLENIFETESIDYDDTVMMIQREIYKNGRSVCRVNGSIVTIGMLKEIGSYLIDIHGQNEHQELMQSENHISLLDYFGQNRIATLKMDYRKKYIEYRKTYKRFLDWQDKEKEHAQKIDILRFQTNEIADANLIPGEEEELEEEERRLANFQSITKALTLSYQVLQENEPSALEFVGRAMDELENIADVDQNLGMISKSVNSIFYEIQEIASTIYNELDKQEFDEARLDEIASRLNLIQQLKRKYGSSIDEILAFYEESVKELDTITSNSETKTELSEKLYVLEKQLLRIGSELSGVRKEVAKELQHAIQDQLKALYMDKVIFKVHFKYENQEMNIKFANKNGLDDIEFYISTNPGEPEKPLTKIASGGELSRIMLALKSIFAKSQGITSIIFDEIDTGVSGRVAQAIADKIHSISIHSQVLCITHLPQVAATADNHLYVKKAIFDNRTTTEAVLLEEAQRIDEIARMLSGNETTEVAIQAAKALRNKA